VLLLYELIAWKGFEVRKIGGSSSLAILARSLYIYVIIFINSKLYIDIN